MQEIISLRLIVGVQPNILDKKTFYLVFGTFICYGSYRYVT